MSSPLHHAVSVVTKHTHQTPPQRQTDEVTQEALKPSQRVTPAESQGGACPRAWNKDPGLLLHISAVLRERAPAPQYTLLPASS